METFMSGIDGTLPRYVFLHCINLATIQNIFFFIGLQCSRRSQQALKIAVTHCSIVANGLSFLHLRVPRLCCKQ